MPGDDRAKAEAELASLRRLAYLLDDAFRIPVINHPFGLDAVIGLVPVIGDLTGYLLSGYLIHRARKLGAPRDMQARMVAWATVDLAVGSVPVIGDVADFIIKPNRRAMRMLEQHLEGRTRPPGPPPPPRSR